jgi:hypothetical protein
MKILSILRNEIKIHGGIEDPGCLGPIIRHFYRVEYQARGQAHFHILLWSAFEITDFKDNKVKAFCDRVEILKKYVSVSSSLLKENQLEHLVQYQSHCCEKKSCKKKGARCSKNFPFPETTTYKYDDDVEDGILVPRESCDRFMNFYNLNIIKALQSNMDLQIPRSPHSVITYLCKYVTKTEKNSSNWKKLFKELKHQNSPKEKLDKLTWTLLNGNEIPIQQAIYDIFPRQLKNYSFSDTVIFLPLIHPLLPENFNRQINWKKIKKQKLQFDVENPDMYFNCLFDYYKNIPLDISYAEFGAKYECTTSTKNALFVSINKPFKKRKKLAILRYHKSSYDKSKIIKFFFICFRLKEILIFLNKSKILNIENFDDVLNIYRVNFSLIQENKKIFYNPYCTTELDELESSSDSASAISVSPDLISTNDVKIGFFEFFRHRRNTGPRINKLYF